jgi:uncharacterized protein
MIVYFDTSAFVPLLIIEPTSAFCRRLWEDADDVVTSRLLYVEAAAALARGRRMARITSQQRGAALDQLDRLWRDFVIVEAGDAVVDRAAELAYQHGLRGYDAVHAASAERLDDGDLVMACGDHVLLGACTNLGISTANTHDG